jgi:hypothetical protein
MLIAVAIAVVVAPAAAEPQRIHGDQFITMMSGNTLSGTNTAGKPFNVYFLPGGTATYSEGAGTGDSGSWHLDKDGDVCVAWKDPADLQEGCFTVTVDGSKVNWDGKAGSGRATLRGGVTDMVLKSMNQ